MNISGIVITQNEENNIGDCLESIKWLDEIIVVDSNSEDKTVEIAKKFTDKIYQFEFENISEKRQFSLTKAANEWILFIDADERVTEELRKEIQSINDNIKYDGYYINRRNFYFGKWIRYGSLYPDYQLRLFNKNKSKITDRVVHEGVVVNGECRKLKNDLLHYTSNDLFQMIKKINIYSTLEAQEHFQNHKKISKIGVFTHSLSAFLRVFISHGAYKDRLYGFYVSFCYAITNMLTHLKLLKLQNKL